MKSVRVVVLMASVIAGAAHARAETRV